MAIAPKRILVATDFSENATQAVYYAVALADPFGSELTLLHVVSPFRYDPNNPDRRFPQVDELYDEIEKLARERLIRMRQVRKNLAINCELVRGLSPAASILDFAEAGNFDLIVMGTHGIAPVKRFLIGSITTRVLRRAAVPVLTLRQAQALDANPSIKNILVPLDFSEAAREVLAYAVAYAKTFHAHLEFLHVIEEFIPSSYFDSEEEKMKLIPRFREKSHQALLKFVADWVPTGVKHDFHVRTGKPHREIVAFADEANVDLIVMMSHGQGGVDRLLIGSITEKVVRIAAQPVLVVSASEDGAS